MRKTLGLFDAPPVTGESLDALVMKALREDHAFDDRSTRPLPGADTPTRGRVLAREAGVIAGVDAFRRAFELVGASSGVKVTGLADGDRFAEGQDVLEVRAPAGVLLSGERTGLNFLQRLSGVATYTARCVEAAGPDLAVCDTRKTTPGLRALEKRAVRLGGGTNHRSSLGDMVMLKENHLALAGGIARAVAAIRADARSAQLPLTIEVRTHAEALEGANAGADRLLLDNMTNEEMARIAQDLRARGAAPELEASGGITWERMPEIAKCGVDCVSLGALTHSVKAVDFSFLLESVQ